MPKKLLVITVLAVMWTSSLWAQNINVTSVDSSRWPEVRLTGVLPAGPDDPENYTLQVGPGRPVAASEITGPLPNDPAGLVVAVDTSRSLTPDRLEAAKRALGRYVDHLDPDEQVALLGFNDTVQLATGFTADHQEIRKNLNSLQLGGSRTELYRGMLYGLELLKNMPGRHHLLVLSDGHDEGSSVTLEQVRQRALDHNIKISAIGLPGTEATGGDSHLPTLRDLATQTGGAYVEAHSAEELNAALPVLLDGYRNAARNARSRLYELTFNLSGPPPRTALAADLRHAADGTVQTASFRLPLPPADMVALASGAAFAGSENRDDSPIAVSAESAAASALAAANGSAAPAAGGGGGLPLANSAAGSLAGPSAMSISNAATVAASPVSAPASGGSAPFWLNPALWLVPAFLLLALGVYYWWKSRREDEYEVEEIFEGQDDFARADSQREPAVDIDRAFVFDPGPVTAPLGGLVLGRPASPFALVFPQASRKIPLRQGVVSIGSAPNNGIVLEEIEVAPNQAEIYVTDTECDIIVLDAEGRIKLNGRPLTTLRTALKPGDELVIGRTRAVLQRNQTAANRNKYREYQRNTAKS